MSAQPENILDSVTPFDKKVASFEKAWTLPKFGFTPAPKSLILQNLVSKSSDMIGEVLVKISEPLMACDQRPNHEGLFQVTFF